MGLFSKVKSAVSKAVSSVAKTVSSAASSVSKAVSSVASKPSPAPTPSKSTSSSSKSSSSSSNKSLAEKITGSNLGIPKNAVNVNVLPESGKLNVPAATGAAAVASLAIPGVGPGIATAIKGASLGTKALLATGTLAGAGYVSQGAPSANKALTGVLSAPSEVFGLGSNVAKLQSGELGFSSFLSDSGGIIAGLAGVAAVAGGSKLLAPLIIAKGLNNDEQEPQEINNLVNDLPAPSTAETPKVLSTSGEVPLTPATQEIKSATTTKKYKRRKATKKKPQNISQRINIVFDDDKVDNKRYIKGYKH